LRASINPIETDQYNSHKIDFSNPLQTPLAQPFLPTTVRGMTPENRPMGEVCGTGYLKNSFYTYRT
jgi:hypothetical protein